MTRYILSLAFLMVVTVAWSQNPLKGLTKVNNDSIICDSNITMLIVPFRPDLYMNEATAEMVEKSGLKSDQILNLYRLQLNDALHNSFSKACMTELLMGSSVYMSDEDEEMIFSDIGYFMNEVPDYQEEKGMQNVFGKNKKKEEQEGRPGELVSKTVSNKGRFLDVKFSSKRTVPAIAKKYEADYVFFVNQFEITGDYSDPGKVMNNLHDRMIKIHYSIFTKSGENVFGSYIIVKYPSGQHNPKIIASTYLPILTEKLVYKLPFLEIKTKK